jgi:CMP-N-acetylneuraminic acid synthetase
MSSSEKPRILAVTLARSGSKSVPHKNIRPINGMPLIAYTIAEAQKSQRTDRYIVSTDGEEIQKVAIQYGAEAPFLRPAEFSGDTASSVSALQHAVAWAEEDEGQRYDYVIELMCTNPMKTVEDIDAAIDKLVTTGANAVIGVSQLEDHHPIRIKKIENDFLMDFCLPEIPESRRQDLKPDAYIRNGSIYALKRDFLMVDGRRYSADNCRPLIMSQEKGVNVDTPVDFLMAEYLLQKYPERHVEPVN